MTSTKSYAVHNPTDTFKPLAIERRTPTAHDVEIEILFCGVCHSDIHQARNEWSNTVYPCVPGHEIVGRITQVGDHVKKFKAGDLVGVGCMVDSCHECASCDAHQEQFCEKGAIFTYNSPDKHTDGHTFGGYSDRVVVDESFVLSVPENLELAAVAPLLCAGITTYSPIKRWGIKPGDKVGVVGLGGLGHMALKFAHAFGAKTVLFTTSPGKTEDAKRLGADEVVVSKNEDEMAAQVGSFDFIIDTVSADHDINTYLNLLKIDGTLTLVGAPEKPLPVAAFGLIFGRKVLTGSLIGGIKETQEMLDFCGKHDIASDIEMIDIQQVNDAYERILKSDVKYRFVIDMQSLKNEA
ncbi:NAD(P)-dependent alcohol dehydrogenase [Luteolibacter pohnpeiensis]|uniref:NAD(P)-dependent alcohol dehydrogenase n=1 Tax=Luteolibacter pohnpeiensis TaxID=454153 RepID=A0A934SCM6_9BACT|nr:NAD(P)-dependent alcohol dehydrogenase [Luteolibacter pohnpeiensis]MBK1882813.1 NAD(P)-dependent alcohol dehydrogenase [Luteolibacter pohnpeiensis]